MSDERRICPACKGSGKLTLIVPNWLSRVVKRFVIRPLPYAMLVPCNRCKGDGWIVSPAPKV